MEYHQHGKGCFFFFCSRSCHEFTDLDLSDAIIGTDVKVNLLLYTRENATCATLLSHANLSTHPHFNLSRPSIFVIHGYRPTGSPPVWLRDLTEVLLNRSDSNIIVVDWNHGAANVNYFKSVENTHKTADNLTAFIKAMKDNGASLSSIHMIGISLGAHISGFVGANLNGAIGRITGLDPAGPTFTGKPPDARLDPTDAQFVDVLHTDIDSLGFRKPLGHIDFYPNGGTDQPGCPKTILSGGSYLKCDHQRSVFLFLESLNQRCVSRAFPCSSYEEFLDGNCINCDRFGAAGCPIFGYDITAWKDVLLELYQTKVYFTTNEQSPFCRTNYKVEVMIWNKKVRWGYLTVKLYGDGGEEAVATIDHKQLEFKKYTVTSLLGQFDKEISSVKKVSLKFSTGNVLKPTYKLRILRVRLTSLEQKHRPLCRYDVLLEENKEVTFKPISCEESNF
uniref:Lipase domain-containing protein n=1 Tax=Salarias fasciatus TaxID=181472 RepID=A0A672GYS7_SALFA